MSGDISRPVGARAAFLALLLLVYGAGCSRRNAYVAPPPPDVVVGEPVQRSVTLYHYYTGTTQASETVQVKARVQGYLDSIHFVDGTIVPQGQLLFVIDPRPYRAQLNQAKAELESKRAAAAQARAVFRRTEALLPSQAATPEQADVDRGNWLVAEAAIAQAQAMVEQAQLNLGYTEIRAPLTGRISRRLVDVGNLIVANTTLLTTIDRYDPMYAYFTVSETDYLGYLKRQRERPAGTLEATAPSLEEAATTSLAVSATALAGWLLTSVVLRQATPRYPLELGLANEEGYPHQGYIDFAENTVDPGTGTLQLRGTFDNPGPTYYLAPGLFVRIRVPIGTQERALLVPQKALGTDQAGQFLLIVNADDVVERRSVTAGQQVGDMRVIEEGLQPGERFIVEGLQRARPGGKVNPRSSVVSRQ